MRYSHNRAGADVGNLTMAQAQATCALLPVLARSRTYHSIYRAQPLSTPLHALLSLVAMAVKPCLALSCNFIPHCLAASMVCKGGLMLLPKAL